MSDQLIESKFSVMVHDLRQDNMHNLNSQLLHGALGISTEAGEILDLVKKNLYYDKPFDKLTMKEELSDELHYIQMILEWLDSSLDEIMEINIAKLSVRYPNGYTQDKALIRDKQEELEAMKKVEERYGKM